MVQARPGPDADQQARDAGLHELEGHRVGHAVAHDDGDLHLLAELGDVEGLVLGGLVADRGHGGLDDEEVAAGFLGDGPVFVGVLGDGGDRAGAPWPP